MNASRGIRTPALALSSDAEHELPNQLGMRPFVSAKSNPPPRIPSTRLPIAT